MRMTHQCTWSRARVLQEWSRPLHLQHVAPDFCRRFRQELPKLSPSCVSVKVKKGFCGEPLELLKPCLYIYDRRKRRLDGAGRTEPATGFRPVSGARLGIDPATGWDSTVSILAGRHSADDIGPTPQTRNRPGEFRPSTRE